VNVRVVILLKKKWQKQKQKKDAGKTMKKRKGKKKTCDELAPGESADNKEKTVAHTLPRVFGRDIA
jgi:hypothetical protein